MQLFGTGAALVFEFNLKRVLMIFNIVKFIGRSKVRLIWVSQEHGWQKVKTLFTALFQNVRARQLGRLCNFPITMPFMTEISMMRKEAFINGPSRQVRQELPKMSYPKKPMHSPVYATPTRAFYPRFLTKFAASSAMETGIAETCCLWLFKNMALKSVVQMVNRNLIRSNPFAGFYCLSAISSVGTNQWIRISTGLQCPGT